MSYEIIEYEDLLSSIEINDINTSKSINIKIEIFFSQFIEYNRLIKRKEILTKEVNDISDKFKKYEILEEIEDVDSELNLFISKVLKLVSYFKNIPVNSDRLRIAKKLFYNGSLKEANNVLKESILLQEQQILIEKINRIK